MNWMDPRAQLAWLAAVVLGALGGRDAGLGAAALLSGAAVLRAGAVRPWVRMAAAVLPLALLVVLLDAAAGRPQEGLRVGSRLLVLTSVGFAFARNADSEALIAGLRALRVPYTIIFVLVVGARFVPATTADLAQLRDAARLRGVPLEGPPWRQLAGWRRLAVPLLVSTVRRGLQLGEAMEARAFAARRQRTTRHQLTWRPRDSVALTLAIAYAAALLSWPLWQPPGG